jgi:hypothetical protein
MIFNLKTFKLCLLILRTKKLVMMFLIDDSVNNCIVVEYSYHPLLFIIRLLTYSQEIKNKAG